MKYQEKEIVDTYQYVICDTYDKAMELAITEWEWKESKILDRQEYATIRLDDGKILDVLLDCICVDAGSLDYIYYLER